MSAITQYNNPDRMGGSGPRGGLAGWLKLLGIMLAVVLFFALVGPLGLEIPYFKPIAQYISDHQINANAYYYTEVEEFADADFYMRANLGRGRHGAD